MIRHRSTQKVRGRHVPVQPAWRSTISVRHLVIVVAMSVLALVTMVHSAAQFGFRIPYNGPLATAINAPRTSLWPSLVQLAEKGRLSRPTAALAQARATLLLAPLHASALSTGALALEALGEDKGSGKGKSEAKVLFAMRHAVEISRREGVAQLWLVNRAVRRNDAAGALAHYDALLRTKDVGNEPLFLQLTAVAQVPQGRAALRPYIRAENPWLAQFLGIAASRSPKAEPIARLLIDNRLPRDFALGGAGDVVIQRLASEQNYRTMWALFDRLPGKTAATANNFMLPASPKAKLPAPPIDWAMTSDGDYGAALDSGYGGPGSSLVAFAASGTRGVVARKLARLRSGTYRLEWRRVGQTANPGAFASLAVGCAMGADRVQSTNIFATQSVGNASGATANGAVSGAANEAREEDRQVRSFMTFSVPVGCPAVVVELTMAGGEGRTDSEIILMGISARAQ